MFAVIKTGGKQFRVAANDRITTAKIEGNPGDTVAFGTVLMLTDGEKTTLDAKALSEITVAAEIVEQARGEKVIAFKKRRRQNCEADIAKWDEELKLRGRATREEWVEQAKELLAGKPPRAKADQAEQASGEDY